MNTIELRQAHRVEYDDIARIWHASASLPGVGPSIMPTIRDLRDRIDVEILDGWSITVAIEAASIIGFVATKPNLSILDQLFVTPKAIGTGMGRLLFNHARAEMPGGFLLHTAESNVRARLFYEKSGMVLVRESAHPRTGHPIVWYQWAPPQ